MRCRFRGAARQQQRRSGHRHGQSSHHRLSSVPEPRGFITVRNNGIVRCARYGPKVTSTERRTGCRRGRALLADAFQRAREQGATRSELATDSRTGALGLYQRVGMEVTAVWVNRAVRSHSLR
nr:GNAT family N-acetyltransferase [Georgenia soli]